MLTSESEKDIEEMYQNYIEGKSKLVNRFKK